MAKTLSNSGIATGNPVLAAQVSQSVQAFTGAEAYDITISGSLNLPANTQMNGTASEAIFATTAGSTAGPVALVTVSEETAAETNFIVFSPSSSVGGSAQNLKNTDTVGAGGATGGLEYNANTGNIKAKSFESSVTAATTVGFVGTSSFANSAVTAQASTLTNEASDTTCFIPFYTAATGDLPTKTNAGLLFDSATQKLTVTSASISDLISTGRVDYVSASFDDLVVSGATRVNERFYALQSASLGDTVINHRARVNGQLIAALQGTLTDASLKFPLVAPTDTFTAMHFDGTTDDMRIEYGHDAADEFFGRIRMSDNLSTDHFDVVFTSSGAGANSTPFSAYGNKVLLAQPSATADAKVGIGVSSSGSIQSLLTVEGSSSAASRVVRVMDKGQNHLVFAVEYDANTDGIARILSGSNGNDGIQLSANDHSYFSKNLGLGDFTPESRFTVRSSASAASRIAEIQNDSGNILFSFENNAGQTAGDFGIYNSSFQEKVKLSSEDNDKMFLGNGTGAPNIGFGTPTPDGDLHIKKTGSVTLKLESDETNGTVYTRFLNDAIGWRLGVQSNDRFALYDSTNAVTHLIAENNSLRSLIGIGTTNPSNAVVLDVAGPMRLSGSMVQKFQALSTANLTYNGAGLITGQSGETVNVSSSLILLTDVETSPNRATVDMTGWIDNAQVGQRVEIALVSDSSPASGIQLQYYNAGNTVTFNGSTRGASLTYSSSVFDCPSRDRGTEVSILKTQTDVVKVFGSAMTVDNT
jgi:hypothetical protein|tara:strand:- start:685 stop:2955 length:2271 start_codon:yes stop_codon:yes gene_type:complete